jgi:hypothetical protein
MKDQNDTATKAVEIRLAKRSPEYWPLFMLSVRSLLREWRPRYSQNC